MSCSEATTHILLSCSPFPICTASPNHHTHFFDVLSNPVFPFNSHFLWLQASMRLSLFDFSIILTHLQIIFYCCPTFYRIHLLVFPVNLHSSLIVPLVILSFEYFISLIECFCWCILPFYRCSHFEGSWNVLSFHYFPSWDVRTSPFLPKVLFCTYRSPYLYFSISKGPLRNGLYWAQPEPLITHSSHEAAYFHSWTLTILWRKLRCWPHVTSPVT